MPASRNTLVLYTGGTIGMQQSAEGLMPASGFASLQRRCAEFPAAGPPGAGGADGRDVAGRRAR